VQAPGLSLTSASLTLPPVDAGDIAGTDESLQLLFH
jgi:hypothetical protein